MSQATNTALGIVKGSETAGQVFVELNGTMSVNGWDTLKTSISNNASAISTIASDISALQTSVSGKQESLTTAQLAAVNSGVTSTKVTTYDNYSTGKQDALTTAQLNAINNPIPVGTIIQKASANIPNGYLLCNGQEVLRTTYSALFADIETIYGAGDGSTTFNVPDFRGCFLRGYGSTEVTTIPGGTIIVSSEAIGVKQADSVRNINGNLNGLVSYDLTGTDAFSVSLGMGKNTTSNGSPWEYSSAYFNASNVVPTSVENRPINYAVYYFIKH